VILASKAFRVIKVTQELRVFRAQLVFMVQLASKVARVRLVFRDLKA
jgi:hypothetical protein